MKNTNLEMDKTLEELILQTPQIASALHFLGIQFLNHTDKTLKEICDKKQISYENLENNIKKNILENSNNFPINSLNIDLIIEYLKHNHYIFIKQRLPFIIETVKKFEGNFPAIKSELQLVFPLFVEDFVSHIYEEEDTLFSYILLLNNASQDENLINKAKAKMMENSIKEFQNDHEIHDDHLKGLRSMTNDFEILPNYDISTKVVLTELKKLDEELRIHAKIENEILFPKALELEAKVFKNLDLKIALN